MMKQKRPIVFLRGMLCLVVVSVLMLPLHAQAQRAERPREPTTVTPTPAPVPAQRPQVPQFVRIWTDKGNNANGNIPVYYVGEQIYISFEVANDCYVTVYDIDSTGNVNILFPNPYYKDNRARVGRTYTIPRSSAGFNLVVQGPTGDEILYAVASDYVFYHWQYGVGTPPIWSDEWGAPATWGHGGSPDQSRATQRFQRRLQLHPNLADLTKEHIKHKIELAKPVLVSTAECRVYVTLPPY